MPLCKFLYLALFIVSSVFAVQAQEAYKFEETTYLRWDLGEVFVIHEFATELTKLPDVKGFILVSGQRGKSMRYAESVKRHLKYYKINPERISTGYGGESEPRRMELWIVPKNAAGPNFAAAAEYQSATSFDDYSWACDPCEYLRRDTLELFAKELKKYPKTKAYIIIHPSRQQYSALRTQRQARRKAVVEKRFLNKLGIKNSRIIALAGDYSDSDYAALWIVPSDSEPPKLNNSNTSNNQ